MYRRLHALEPPRPATIRGTSREIWRRQCSTNLTRRLELSLNNNICSASSYDRPG
ncbi:hypothetical protein DOTSEDRAFT_74213 [Dothistroma septosporum NZE10]|uniref:Uncharacterized protein n=1 Tax=Dothistroma septosporum (strain NZE10 / CBS 128990) TaxID=675120 RepID=N1PEP8_DOTSN|nr:hypothetical protein DOTSEDRAFT_74213 [Dothistroma septosporum NZE10]